MRKAVRYLLPFGRSLEINNISKILMPQNRISQEEIREIKGLEGKGKSFADKLLLNIDDYESMRTIVFDEYINHYGEYQGISKFSQNYICLKIKDDFPATDYFNPLDIDVNNLVI